MLDEGSGALSAIELHEALAKIGAQFDIDIGSDATLVSMTTLSRFADRGLSLMADMVVRPAFTEGDFMRVRQLRLHRLTQLRDMPGAVADPDVRQAVIRRPSIWPHADGQRAGAGVDDD
jgi:zinc protease